MGRSLITVTTIARTGSTAPAAVTSDATNKHAFVNDGRTFLEIVSSDAGAQYIDVEIVSTVDGQSVTSKRVPVAAGARVKAGSFPTNVYNQTSAQAAAGTLTSDATAPANNDTVTIDTRVYTFKTTLTGAANEVLIGASAAAALTNLKAAIAGTAGAGTTYGTGTVAHATVTAGTLTSTTLALQATTAGSAGNAIATTETSTHLSFGAATLTGGLPTNVVLVDPSVSSTLALYAYSL